MELPFDRIEIKNNGSWAPIALDEWMKIDCTKRVDQIMHGQVQFSRNGQRVPSTVALAGINSRK